MASSLERHYIFVAAHISNTHGNDSVPWQYEVLPSCTWSTSVCWEASSTYRIVNVPWENDQFIYWSIKPYKLSGKSYLVCNHTPIRLIDRQDRTIRPLHIDSEYLMVFYSRLNSWETMIVFVIEFISVLLWWIIAIAKWQYYPEFISISILNLPEHFDSHSLPRVLQDKRVRW